MQREFSSRGRTVGGALGYPSEKIFEEVAYIAYHFHWSYSDLMDLNHMERQLWIQEIAKINERLNEAKENDDDYRWQL